MPTVLVEVTAAAMKYQDESNLGRQGFIWFILPHHCSSLKEVSHELTKRRNLEAGAATDTEGVSYWLVSHGLLSLLSYRTVAHLPRDGPAYGGLGFSTSILVKKMERWLGGLRALTALPEEPGLIPSILMAAHNRH